MRSSIHFTFFFSSSISVYGEIYSNRKCLVAEETFFNIHAAKDYLEIKKVIGKILMKQDPKSIYCCWNNKPGR